MARPRSDERRSAIMTAAIRVIAAQGLGAPTAMIAQEAGISNGSLFTYFETKADLFNQLYVELKTEMGAAALDGLPTESDIRTQALHIWTHWLCWATSCPAKRRTLARLGVSDAITVESHRAASDALVGIRRLLERSRDHGPMRTVQLGFMLALMSALADATIDYMLQDPANADTHCEVGFAALWRVLS